MSYEELFDQSYERVKRLELGGREFFDAFYDKFVAASGAVAEHFKNTDMARQREMLKKSFYGLFIFYATKNANDYLDQIALKHAEQFSIPDDLYDVWLESLIETVREFDPQCDSEIELSWRLVLAPGLVYMKHKYQ